MIHVEIARAFRRGVLAGAIVFTVMPTARAEPTLNPAIAGSFQVTTFAAGLNFPTSMQRLADGSLLVATSDPNPGGNYFNSTGSLRRFTDADDDGVADDSGQVVFSGLPGAVTSVRQAGDLFFVTSAQNGAERISVLRAGPSPSDSMSLVGSIDFDFPAGFMHKTYALAVRESPTQPGSHEVYFNVGSQTNNTRTTTPIALSGLIEAEVNGDSIYRFTVTDNGETPTFTGLEQIATGLRNAAGIDFDPILGDLYFQDNGIDGLTSPNEPLSADELNRIVTSEIGGAIEDFGFPDIFVPYRTGGQGGPGDNPLVAFQPIPDPLTGAEAEGAAEIAFAPLEFEQFLGRGLFVGFHGKFNQGGLDNEENPLVFYSLDTDSYFHFIENDQEGVGHFDGLLATPDRLFVSDISTTGGLFSPLDAGRGAIYVIRTIPEPSALRLALIGTIAGLGVLVRRGSRR